MQTLRQFAVILILMVITAGFLMAKGGQQEGTQVEPAPGKTEAEEAETKDPYAPVDGKRYELSLMISGKVPWEESNREILDHWSEVFDCDFELMWFQINVGHTELFRLFATGQIPDVFGSVKGTLPEFVHQGFLSEIPLEVIKKYAPGVYKDIAESADGAWAYGKVDVTQYGIPASWGSRSVFRPPIVFRGDWLEKLGIDKTPETLEEFEEAVYAFAHKDPDGNGKKDTYGLADTAMQGVFGAYGYVPNANFFGWSRYPNLWQLRDGRVVIPDIQPEMKEALKRLHKWYVDGVIDPEFITGENTGGYWALSHFFLNGKIGVSSMGSHYHWNPPLLDKKGEQARQAGANYVELMKIDPKIAESLRFAVPPVGPGGKQGMMQKGFFLGTNLVFSVNLENEKDKIGKLLTILEYTSGGSKDNYYSATYGVKGTHWDWVDGAAKPIGDFTDRNVRDANAATMLPKVGSMKISRWAVSAEEFKWGYGWKFDVGGIRSVIPSYYTQLSLSKYQAELHALGTSSYIKMITGQEDIDAYWPAFVETFKKTGGDMLQQESQQWYDSQE